MGKFVTRFTHSKADRSNCVAHSRFGGMIRRVHRLRQADSLRLLCRRVLSRVKRDACMSSDFDKVFTEVAARREAKAHSQLLKKQEAERQQQLARSIAEPYLTALALDVREQLRDLGIPMMHYRQSGRFLKKSHAFWPLDLSKIQHLQVLLHPELGQATRYQVRVEPWITRGGLCISADGYFVNDYRQSGRDGFENMMRRVDLVENLNQAAPYGTNTNNVYVHLETGRVVLWRRVASEYFDDEYRPLDVSTCVAGDVLDLRHLRNQGADFTKVIVPRR